MTYDCDCDRSPSVSSIKQSRCGANDLTDRETRCVLSQRMSSLGRHRYNISSMRGAAVAAVVRCGDASIQRRADCVFCEGICACRNASLPVLIGAIRRVHALNPLLNATRRFQADKIVRRIHAACIRGTSASLLQGFAQKLKRTSASPPRRMASPKSCPVSGRTFRLRPVHGQLMSHAVECSAELIELLLAHFGDPVIEVTCTERSGRTLKLAHGTG